MQDIKNYLQLSSEDLELRRLICQLLQNVLEEIYTGCRVLLFGSSANGLGVKGCDVDMTLLTTDQHADEMEVLSDVREIIQRFAPGCKNVSVVQSSKNCNIVKFLHSESRLNVDLSLNNRYIIMLYLKRHCLCRVCSAPGKP